MIQFRKIILVLLIQIVILGSSPHSFGYDEIESNLQAQQINLNAYTPVMHDGVITTGEYSGQKTINSGSSYNLYYTVNGTTLYYAISIASQGFVGLGIKRNSAQDQMSNADITISYYSTSAVVRDDFGIASTAHSADSSQDILSFAGSEVGGTTIIEFSKKLNTGDSNRDNIITLGSTTYLIWSYHNTADDFSTFHDNMGYSSIIFQSTPPSSPRNLAATLNSNQIDLSWTDPLSDGGALISGYQIYRSSTQGGPYTQIGNSVSTSFTDTDLTAGQTYYYVVNAINVNGGSEISNEDQASINGPPSSPIGLIALGSDGQVDLSWTVPSTNGGSAILHYNIYRSTTAGSGFQLLNTAITTAYSDTAINNGVNYYYVVTAENAIGSGSSSNEASATPTGASTPPRNLIVSKSGTDITLNWALPTNDGGFSITSYSIYRGTVQGGPYSLLDTSISTLYVDTTGTNGNTYYFVVTAVNSAGESQNSNEARITLADVPDSPGVITITSDDIQINLNWSNPNDHGFAIEDYNVYRSTVSGGIFTLIGTNTSTRGYVDITVSNGQQYYYIITAVNIQGESSYSIQIGTIPGRTSDQPKNLIAYVTSASVDLEWDEPTDNGGFEVSEYNIYKSNEEFGPYTLAGSSLTTNYTDLSVTIGDTYYFRITAINAKGESLESNSLAVLVISVSSEPLNLNLTLNNINITLSWSDPLFTGGTEIVNFRIYRSQISGKFYTYIGNNDPKNTFTDQTVIKGTSYYYVVSAINAVGESLFSNEANITYGAKPLAPRGLVSFSGTNNISLSWVAPISDGGSEIKGYNVYRTDTEELNYKLYETSSNLTFTDFNVEGDTTYLYLITAENGFGEGEASNEVFSVLLGGVASVTSEDSTGQKNENVTERLYNELIFISMIIAAIVVPIIIGISLFTGRKTRQHVLTDENINRVGHGVKTISKKTADGVIFVGEKSTKSAKFIGAKTVVSIKIVGSGTTTGLTGVKNIVERSFIGKLYDRFIKPKLILMHRITYGDPHMKNR